MSESNVPLPDPTPSLSPTSHLLLPVPPSRGPRKGATSRKRTAVRVLHTGDPACWAWKPFYYRGSGGPEAGARAFYAWHKRRCGICGEVKELVIDHDHNTALIRGLLCDDCNKAEGRARAADDVYARWRACPSAALLGIEVAYRNPVTGEVAEALPFKVTGPTYLPEWAPAHFEWPPASFRPPAPAAAPASPAPATGQYPVVVGDVVAVGMAGSVASVRDGEIGRVVAVHPFGVTLNLNWMVEDDGPCQVQEMVDLGELPVERLTIRWEAIDAIRHLDTFTDEDGKRHNSMHKLYDFDLRWCRGAEYVQQARARRRSSRSRRAQITRGYL